MNSPVQLPVLTVPCHQSKLQKCGALDLEQFFTGEFFQAVRGQLADAIEHKDLEPLHWKTPCHVELALFLKFAKFLASVLL